jgi:hypothetical protein
MRVMIIKLLAKSVCFCTGSSILLVSSVFAQTYTKSATPWPEFPEPPKAKVEWVSNDMRVNGLPMKVLHFNSQVAKAEIVAYYQAHWDIADKSLGLPADSKIKGAVVSQVGKDTVIGKVHGPFYMSVKVKDQGLSGSQGTMTTSMILGVSAEINPKGVPAPSDAKAMSVIESADFGKQSKQVLFVSRNSVAAVKSFYQQSLPASGWTLLDLHGDGRAQNGISGFVMTFVKSKQQLDIIIGHDVQKGATVVNVNLISL